MPGTDPTLNITIQDVFNRIGDLDGKVERYNGLLNSTVTEVAGLKLVMQERCSQHKKDVDCVAEANRENAKDIVDINKRLDATRDFAKGGLSVGKVALIVIGWMITTFGGAVAASHLTAASIQSQTQQVQKP